MVGALALTTEKTLLAVVAPLLPITVTFLRPAAAAASTVTFAVSWVALLKVVELTVMPVPLKVALDPATKLEPVMTTSRAVVPGAAVDGARLVIEGPALKLAAVTEVTLLELPAVALQRSSVRLPVGMLRRFT